MASREVTIKVSATDQFSPTMNKLRGEMQQVEQQGRRTSSMFGQMGMAIEGALAGVTLGAVAGAIGELNRLGIQVHANEAVFTQLAGGIEQADVMMERLRATTMNTVDDMGLMAGANKLMRMNIADNADEVEDLIGLITRLKDPTESTGAAIENFSLMLANQSMLRLDSFGLSSGRVRDRMEELQKTMSREDAFRVATVEEMRGQVERLGDAANVVNTSWNRMSTNVQNITQDLGEFTAQGIEAGAMLLELAGIGVGRGLEEAFGTETERAAFDQETQALVESVEFRARAIAEGYNNVLGKSGEGFDTASFFTEALMAMEEYERTTELAVTNVDELTQALTMWRGVGVEASDVQRQALQFLLENLGMSNRGLEAFQEQRLNNEREYQRELQRSLNWDNALAHAEQQRAEALAEQQRLINDASMNRLISAYDMGGVSHAGIQQGTIGDTELYTSGQSSYFSGLASDAADALDTIKALHDQELISDAELKQAQAYADATKSWADEAKRGAEALENMTLAQAMGTDDPNRLRADMSGRVMDAAQAAGYTEEQLTQLQAALDDNSGAANDVSRAFDDAAGILAQIGAEVGSEEMTAALNRVADELARAKVSGGTPNVDAAVGYNIGSDGALLANPFMQQFYTDYAGTGTGGGNPYAGGNGLDSLGLGIAPYAAGAGGVGGTGGALGGGGDMTPDPADSEQFALAGERYQEAIAASVDPTEAVADAWGMTKERTKDIADDLELGKTHTEGISNELQAIASKVHRVKLKIDVDAPKWLRDAFAANLLQVTVQNNGGRVPGEDSRVRD